MTTSAPTPPTVQPYGPPPKKKRSRLRWILGGAVVLIVIIVAATSGGGSKNKPSGSTSPAASDSTAAQSAQAPKASTAPNVSSGLGSKDASGDIKLGKLKVSKQFGVGDYTVPVTITNHSSKRSDYIITVALESADGKTQIDTADLFEENIEPGQSKLDSGSFLSADTGDAKVPAGAKLVLQEVERTASV